MRFGRPGKQGFRTGSQDFRGDAVPPGVVFGKAAGEFVTVLAAEAAVPAGFSSGQGAGGADPQDTGPGAGIQDGAGQGAPRGGGFIDLLGKNLQEQAGPGVDVRGTKEALGQGEFKI
jgi:hypothetical protein